MPNTTSVTDSILARESSDRLARAISGKEHPELKVSVGETGELIALPTSVAKLLIDGLAEFAKGHDVRLLPVHAELTTQEAADLLNLSRQYVVRLLDEGKIPSQKVGTHRRVRAADVLVYKQTLEADRLDALKKLVAEAQDLDMGY